MRVVWGWVWCKQGNSGKDRRLNNEQWSRIEQVTLALVYWVTGARSCFMWEHGLVTLQVTIHRPRARKVGADGREHLETLTRRCGYSWKCHTGWNTPCFSVSGYRWVAAGQLDSALLFTNLHIYNNWHNRHHVRHKTMPRPPGQPHQVIITQNYSVITIWWWFDGLC